MSAISKGPQFIMRKGKPVSVILPIKTYNKLIERLEDAEDLAELERLRKRPQYYRPFEEYLAERKHKR